MKKETIELQHPDGIKAYLEKIIRDDAKKPIHEGAFNAEKDEDKVRVELTLRWTESTDDQVRSYVNGIRTRGGGTHESGLRSGVAKAVKNYMDVHEIKAKGLTITPDDSIWYTDFARGMLGRFDPKTGQVREWPSPGGKDSEPYAITSIGSVVWYSESAVR